MELWRPVDLIRARMIVGWSLQNTAAGEENKSINASLRSGFKARLFLASSKTYQETISPPTNNTMSRGFRKRNSPKDLSIYLSYFGVTACQTSQAPPINVSNVSNRSRTLINLLAISSLRKTPLHHPSLACKERSSAAR